MKIDWQTLRFPFDDSRWQAKALIGGLLGIGSMFFPPFSLVLALPLSGYSLRLMRLVIQGKEPVLPEWDDWGELFTDGIKAWVVGLVYSLPMLVIICCSFGCFFSIFPLMAAAGDTRRMALAFAGSMVLYEMLIFVVVAVIFWIMIPTLYYEMVALTRLAATGSLNSAFEFREVFQLGRKGFRNYLLAFIGLYGILGIIYMITMAVSYTIVLSCLFPVLIGAMTIYGVVLCGELFGKAYFYTNLDGEPMEGKLTPIPSATSPLIEKTGKPRATSKKKAAE
jgi:hypothetical protein